MSHRKRRWLVYLPIKALLTLVTVAGIAAYDYAARCQPPTEAIREQEAAAPEYNYELDLLPFILAGSIEGEIDLQKRIRRILDEKAQPFLLTEFLEQNGFTCRKNYPSGLNTNCYTRKIYSACYLTIVQVRFSDVDVSNTVEVDLINTGRIRERS